MPHRILQRAGVFEFASEVRQTLTDPDSLAVGLGGTGIGILFAVVRDGMAGNAFTFMWISWLCWMCMGTVVAMHRGEGWDWQKIWGGCLYLAAAYVLWLAMASLDTLNPIGDAHAAMAVGLFLGSLFTARVVKKAGYFWTGLRDVLKNYLPGLVEERPDRPESGT